MLPKVFNFDHTEVKQILNISSISNYNKDEYIISSGERDRNLLLIKSGKAIVEICDENKLIKVAELNSGTLIGELNFTIPIHRSAFVKAIEDCEIVKIDYSELCNLLVKNSIIANKFFLGVNKILVNRIKNTI